MKTFTEYMNESTNELTKGVYCWFGDGNIDPFVAKFGEKVEDALKPNDTIYKPLLSSKGYKYCEPFNGKLPSFIHK